MTDQLAGSALSVAAVLVFIVLTVRHGITERRRPDVDDHAARASCIAMRPARRKASSELSTLW